MRIVLLLVGGFVAFAIVCILVVTFLGKSASSKFSRVGPAIDTPADASWQTFTAPDKSFTILMPGTPLEKPLSTTTEDGITSKGIAFATVRPEGLVEVDYFDLMPGLVFDLDAGVDGVNTELRGTVTKRTPQTVQGLSALDAEISTTGGTTLIRIIDAGDRLYYFQVSGRTARTADFEKLTSSFTLRDKPDR